jgi:glycosyltransferase involved in cell wall biosynthesis
MAADRPRTVVVDALAARFGGTAYALIQLVRALRAGPDPLHLVVVTRAGSIVERGLAGEAGVELVVLSGEGRCELLRRTWWQMRQLPRLARDGVGLISFSGIVPRDPRVPTVSYLLNPVAFELGGVGNAVRRWAIRRTLRRPGTVLVPSTAMGELVERGTGVRPRIVPLGIDPGFAPAVQAGSDVLCVADFYPHKRHDLVVRAWRGLPEPRPRLRLVGNSDVDPAWRDKVAGLAGDEEVIESGLPLAQLASAYREARMLVLASRHESFSMPVAESLASGTPALLADHQVLRETGGSGSVFVAGDDPDDWTAAMRGLLEDDETHARLRAAGIEHVKRFTVASMATGVGEAIGAEDPVQSPRSPWPGRLVLAGLIAVLALVVVAALVSRQPRQGAAASVPQAERQGIPDGASYGAGIARTVAAPDPGLRQVLGPTWHELDAEIGRISISPAGQRARYFSLGFVAWAFAPARLEILTSVGGRGLEGISEVRSPQVVTFGPLRAPPRAPIGAALSSVRVDGSARGPRILVSPMEARYLQPGEAVTRPARVSQVGQGGLRGLEVPAGGSARLRITPGIHGPSDVRLRLTGVGNGASIAVTAASVTRRVVVPAHPKTVMVGPVPAVEAVTVQVISGTALIGPVRLVPRAAG